MTFTILKSQLRILSIWKYDKYISFKIKQNHWISDLLQKLLFISFGSDHYC
jgi:hypothetical protein